MNERRGKGQKTAKKAHLDWLPPYWQVATYTRLAVNPRGPLFVHRAYQAMGTLKWRLEGNKQRKWAKTVGRERTRLTTQGLRVSKWSFKLDSFHSLIKTCYYPCVESHTWPNTCGITGHLGFIDLSFIKYYNDWKVECPRQQKICQNRENEGEI